MAQGKDYHALFGGIGGLINLAGLMGTRSALLVVLFLIGASPHVQAQTTETNSFNNLNEPIPDGDAAGMSDVQTLASAITDLTSVRVRLRVAGEFNGDLYGYLRHIEGGVTNFCVLLNRVGRSAANLAGYADAGLDVVFDDGASQGDIHTCHTITNPPAGTALTGAWQPDGRDVDPAVVLDTTARTTYLNSFTNVSGSGEWTLYLADVAYGGTNMLLGWELWLGGTAAPAITWPTPADIVYGTALGSAQLNASSTVPGTFTYHPPAGTVLNAASGQVLSVTFHPTDTNTYASVTTNVTINVLQKTLTITAVNTNKLYGAPVPGLTAAYSGFVNGDTASSLTSQATLSTSATAASPVGGYPITAGGAAGANYTITYVPGTLLVAKASTMAALSSSGNPSLPGQPVTLSLALGAVAPGAGTPSGTVQFRIDGVSAGGAVSLIAGTASYTTTTLAHGSHSVTGEYAGDTNFGGVTNVLSPAQVINTPPVPGPITLERGLTNGVKISIADLLTNDSDADGDSITLAGVNTTSANGGAVVTNSGWIFYTPAPGFTNTDTFTYTISDGWGAPVTGVVTVNISVDTGPSRNLAISNLGNGSFAISGSGIPGRTYIIQYTTNSLPTLNWQTLGTATADGFGSFVLVDAGGSSLRFYRAVYP